MAPREKLTLSKIIEAALKVCQTDERGYDGMTLSAVAGVLNIKSPSLYNHVNGLDALKQEMGLYGLERFSEAISAAAFGQSGREAVLSVGKAYVEFALKQPILYRAMTLVPDPYEPKYAEKTEKLVERLTRLMQAFVESERERIHAVRGLRSLLHGFVSIQGDSGFRIHLDVSESLKFALSVYIDGLEVRKKENTEALKSEWQKEADWAFKGWDFSHLDGRWQDEVLPWSYEAILSKYIKPKDRLLDMGTGGGEFLLSLKHDPTLTAVTEAYPPNYALCKERLEPLGIEVAKTDESDRLPFEPERFDVVINRHESFDSKEVARVLKPGGYFVTQQVGGANNRDLSMRLIENFVPPYPEQTRDKTVESLKASGFDVLRAEEVFTPLRFFDVGALVYFAKVIEWEFPGFSVDKAFESLLDCQREIEEKGFVEGTEHRFLIVARKGM
jgi:AcrR family transcriptional regulator/SAM-dependent methyltransferase